MSMAASYLEVAKVDELAEEFRQAGYRVHLANGESDASRYDLVAEQGDRKIAVEVVARIRLRDDAVAEKVTMLREQARQQGFDQFRLVLVSPPRENIVAIEGLNPLLFSLLVEQPLAELAALARHTRVLQIDDIAITGTTIGKEGIQVVGTGIVLVELEHDNIQEGDSPDEEIDFPFYFDLILSQGLVLQQIRSLRVDTESFYR